MKIGDYYNLENEEKTILSKKEVNGYEDQYFKKENVKWVVFDINEETGETLLITEKPIEQKLTLKGKTGYEKRNRRAKQIV